VLAELDCRVAVSKREASGMPSAKTEEKNSGVVSGFGGEIRLIERRRSKKRERRL
jgi:hypothetical protein